MEHIKLAAEPRTVTGKAVRRLRRSGLIPIVVYGGNLTESLSLQVGERELQRALHHAGAVRVIDLQVAGKSYPVLARSVDRHPTRHELWHADFLAVRLDQLIEADVPLVMVGESTLVENDEAILMQVLDVVKVEALPDNLPAHVDVDISALTEVGQHITVADLKVPSNVKLVTEGETLIVSLAPPARTVEEEDAAEAAEAAEAATDEEGDTSGEASEEAGDEEK